MRQSLRLYLSGHVEETGLSQWFDPLALALDDEKKRLLVTFPHPLFARWFEQTGKSSFESACGELFPRYAINYAVAAEQFPVSLPQVSPLPVFSQDPAGRGQSGFSGKFTFDTFFTNRKNQFPLISARQVAEKANSRLYNPFVVTGGNGSGKTHLLRAMENEARRVGSYSSIFFARTEELTGGHAALRGKNLRSLFDTYEMVLIDDIQRIGSSIDMQKDLAFLCDSAKEADKQLVVACLGRLSEYPSIHPTLRSRLESGLCVELREPDLDIRCRFINFQCRALNIRLNKDQSLLLAQRFKHLRSLEGIILKIAAYSSLVNRDITDNELDQILKHTDGGSTDSVTPERIITLTARHFGLTPADLTGVSRKYGIVLARQFAMLLCRELTGASYPALGSVFGGKDHTTAIYSVKKMSQLREYNKDIQEKFTELKQLCLHDSNTAGLPGK